MRIVLGTRNPFRVRDVSGHIRIVLETQSLPKVRMVLETNSL